MDFIVNGILCETRPEKTKEEKYREIMNFLDLEAVRKESAVRGYDRDDPRVAIGESVRIVRETIRYTQDELGMILGIKQAEISHIENGCRMITTHEILTLFDYVPDIDKNVFFGGRKNLIRPTDQKYIYVCSLLNPNGFEFLNAQLDLLMGHPGYHI